MDKYSCNVSSNPTFSSTLLDSIYHSMDQGQNEHVVCRETLRNKQHGRIEFRDEKKMDNFQTLQMIENWMEKESEKVVVQRSCFADFVPRNKDNQQIFYSNSSRSSSDTSSGGGFSSSEAEDYVFASPTNRSPSSSCYGFKKSKPIKTNIVLPQQMPKHEGGFEKTKSKDLQIYFNLNKAKQPTSPNGKFASFLNSVFSTMHEKRAKFAVQRKSKSSNSSSSSFSRSCLRKTPSSREILSSNESEKLVRFNPVSEIVDDYFQPSGHKTLHKETPRLEEGKDIRNQTDPSLISGRIGYMNTTSKDGKDNFDAVSCCSSDLFELDNFSAIGLERYTEELPETTQFDTNVAI
ncbi:hypothetical protein LIER_22904 [Lithospermum erythrorhizon]|uniref:Protein BIG GRAIN 1-like B n=1 Tax=Lithospermum erythrorhizon TaxID=34254 RepID=A0AAV3QVH6_LITER